MDDGPDAVERFLPRSDPALLAMSTLIRAVWPALVSPGILTVA